MVSLPPFAGLATGLHGPTADIAAFRVQRPLSISSPRAIPVFQTSFEATGTSWAKVVDLISLSGRRRARPTWIGD
jgi:hypothetical protein